MYTPHAIFSCLFLQSCSLIPFTSYHLLRNKSPISHHVMPASVHCCFILQCHRLYSRVSTNLIEQISRRFPGDSRRDFKKIPGHVCIGSACYIMWSCLPCRCSLPKYRTKTWYAFYTTWGCSKDKIGRPVSTQISDLVPSFMTGNQCSRSPYIKISRRSSKFQEISRISRSCRHPV